MNTSEFLDVSDTDDSDTDSFNTLSTFYYNGYKKRRLGLKFPARVTKTLYQYQIHEYRNQGKDIHAERTTNLIYLKPKQKPQNRKIIQPTLQDLYVRRARPSLTYMKTDAEGRKIVYKPHVVE